MSSRSFDPSHLDVATFASAAGDLDGLLPLSALDRLAASALPDAPSEDHGPVRWGLRGESRAAAGGEAEIWLHITAAASISLTCQRCLQPCAVPLNVERGFRFVHGEAAAAALDEESEEDVLALSRSFDALTLVEDELLLALPLVPRHDRCPVPLPLRHDDLPEADAQDHPFAVLAALRRGGPAS